METIQEETTFIRLNEWNKFINNLKKILKNKIKDNSNEEYITIEREELDLCWPELMNYKGQYRYFARIKTVATLLDAKLDGLVIADCQNGEKLKFYKNKISHYKILKGYQKRYRLLMILFILMIILAFLSVGLAFWHISFCILSIILSFTAFTVGFYAATNKRKSKGLKKIEETLQMIQPSPADIADSIDDPIAWLIACIVLENSLKE